MKKYKKKIFFLTGKRGGFDAMTPLLDLLKKSNDLDLKIIATDQHLLKKFGYTISIVKKKFNKNVISLNLKQKNSKKNSRLISMSKLVETLSKLLISQKPDLLLVYGDRAESLIASFVANNLNIKICHFQGGDLTGNIDERFRHAITKMSDYHFVSNDLAKKRLIQLGEDKRKVFNYGDNHVDALKKVKIINKLELSRKIKIRLNQTYIVLLFHPDGVSYKKNKLYIKTIIKALLRTKLQVHCIYPCTDIGYDAIIEEINKISKKNSLFKIHKNLEYKNFISLVKNSFFFIGNSSSGIIESAYLKVPTINLGDRQKNRLVSKNVVNSKINFLSINKNILFIRSQFFLNKMKSIKKYYGDGKSYLKTYIKLRQIIKIKNNNYNKFFYDF